MSADIPSLSTTTLSRRERMLVLGALATVVALAWAYLFAGASQMDVDMASMAQSAMHMAASPWTAKHFALTVIMWVVMMIAMMLPSAAPMVLTYAAVARKITPGQSQASLTAAFVVGYLLVWSAFSVGATLLQWGLERTALLLPTMVASSHLLGGVLLITAGLYQWSPVKEFCLRHCQSPIAFVGQHWRSGVGGAMRMGSEHGIYCVGCCWALMLLLFVGGVMNLLWVAVISVFVLLEKLIGPGTRPARWITGGSLITAGFLLVMAGF